MTRNLLSVISFTLAAGWIAPTVTQADDSPGNRYNLSPRLYQSEVSAAKAYLLTNHDRGNKSKDEYANAIILDVRRVSEHVAGHPPGAYSVPFPHISGSPACADDDGVTPCLGAPADSGYIGYDVSADAEIGFGDETMKDGVMPITDFVSYVESIIPDRDTPILTLCATGYRSVQAANALVKYADYSNVRNIWEGFNGQPKYAYAGNEIAVDEDGNPIALDLNNDGVVDGNDRDGWGYYQELPVSTQIHPQRIDRDFADLYYQ